MINLDEIKKIPIEDYARYIGLHTYRVGSYISVKEHDSIRIDTKKNCFYRNSTGENGSVIDFAVAMNNCTFNEAIDKLKEFSPSCVIKSEHDSVPKENHKETKDKTLELPKKAEHNRNCFAYLIKTRKIDKEIVKSLVKKKMLYQDERGNCVFVSYDDDGRAVFANKRGTNTSKRYIADCVGCDYSQGFFIDNKASELVITESVIDALSIMTIYKNLGSDLNYNYLALSGCTKFEKAIEHHLNRTRYDTVTICLDNDEAGHAASIEIEKYIGNLDLPFDLEVFVELPVSGKDYNDYLKEMCDCDYNL